MNQVSRKQQFWSGVVVFIAGAFAGTGGYMAALDSVDDWNWFRFSVGALAYIAAGLYKWAKFINPNAVIPENVTVGSNPAPEPEKPVQRTDGPLFDDIDYEPVRNNYTFSQRSLANLGTCHPDLQKVAKRALQLTKWDFAVICGKRSVEEQRVLVDTGKSWTMKSRHILTPSHALDFMAYGPDGGTWDLQPYYYDIVDAFKQASRELNIPITAGLDWRVKDGGHIELQKTAYPDPIDVVLS